MSQTHSKNSAQNIHDDYSFISNGSQVGGQTSALDEPSSFPNLVSSQEREAIKLSKSEETKPIRKRQASWWRFASLRFASLRTKATVLAITIGTIPVVLVGTTAYFAASEGIKQEIIQNEKINASDLEDKLNLFIKQQYDNIVLLSQLNFLTDPKIRDSLSTEEKKAILDRYINVFQTYNNINVVDLKGYPLFKSEGKTTKNSYERDWFQAVLKTDRPFISDPRPAVSTGVFSFFVAAPIKEQATGETIGIIRGRLSMKLLDGVFGVDPTRGQQFYMTDAEGEITASSDPEVLQKRIEEVFPKMISQIQQKGNQELTTIVTENGKEQIFTYTPNQEIDQAYSLNWGLLLARPTKVAFAPQKQLLLTLVLGSGIFTVLVGAIAAIIANRATRPILEATTAVEKFGQGELDTRLIVQGEDELAQLGANINGMAEQITTLLKKQAFAAQEQRQVAEALQNRVLELLEEVEPISQGDLTIQAKVTADDIGTIADSYNFIVGNLREIVTKVQTAANNVAQTTVSSENYVQMLSTEAFRQTEEITVTLKQVQEMAESVRLVAANAQKASEVVQQANQTVQEGDAAMNRTVDGMIAIRETVAGTRQKVKYLGESSQKISTVVNLINSFAAQTKLLAFNASIEAARAGEEGRGFAVVADEVRTLAQQSAEATTEIEKLVTAIQGETNEVIAAMEAGTEQVVMGTRLVNETRQSLNKITAASAEINQLVESITLTTVQQSTTSETVTQTMTDVVQIAKKTTEEASRVSSSFKELRTVAQVLQEDVGQFKVK